jgi:hypothetical protein
LILFFSIKFVIITITGTSIVEHQKERGTEEKRRGKTERSCTLFPDHPPKVSYGVGQRGLRAYVHLFLGHN